MAYGLINRGRIRDHLMKITGRGCENKEVVTNGGNPLPGQLTCIPGRYGCAVRDWLRGMAAIYGGRTPSPAVWRQGVLVENANPARGGPLKARSDARRPGQAAPTAGGPGLIGEKWDFSVCR